MEWYYMRISNICNADCVYCYHHYRNKTSDEASKTLEECKEEVVKAKADGYEWIHFSYGESTLCPFLTELVLFIHEQGLHSSMISNGILLSNENLVASLTKINRIEISIDAFDDDVNDDILQFKGATRLQKMALQNLEKYNIPVAIVIVINRLNYKQLPHHVSYVSKFKNIQDLSLIYAVAKPKKDDDNSFVPLYSLTEKSIAVSGSLLKNKKIKFIIENIPLCFLRHNKLYEYSLEYLGKPTCPEPNLICHKEEECKSCLLNKKCKGINERYFRLYGTSELKGRAYTHLED